MVSRRSRKFIITHSTPSLKNVPCVALETVPLLVRLTMAVYRRSYHCTFMPYIKCTVGPWGIMHNLRRFSVGVEISTVSTRCTGPSAVLMQ